MTQEGTPQRQCHYEASPLWTTYSSLLTLLSQNSKTLSELKIQPSNVSTLLRNDAVCLQQILSTILDWNRKSYKDCVQELERMVRVFREVVEVVVVKFLGVERWVRGLSFRSRKGGVENQRNNHGNGKGKNNHCIMCESYLTECRVRQIYGQLSKHPGILLETQPQHDLQNTEDQNSEAQRNLINMTISNYNFSRSKLISSKTARADVYLQNLIEQQASKSNQIQQFLKRAQHSNPQFNRTVNVFSNVIQEMQTQIKNLISDRYMKKFQEFTNLVKKQSMEMIKNLGKEEFENESFSDDNGKRNGMLAELESQQVEKEIVDLSPVSQDQFEKTLQRSVQLEKQLTVLKEAHIKLQSSRRSLQMMCRNLSSEKSRLQQSCTQLQEQNTFYIQKIAQASTKILESNYSQTNIVMVFLDENQVMKKLGLIKKKTVMVKKSSRQIGTINRYTEGDQASQGEDGSVEGQSIYKAQLETKNRASLIFDLPQIPEETVKLARRDSFLQKNGVGSTLKILTEKSVSKKDKRIKTLQNGTDEQNAAGSLLSLRIPEGSIKNIDCNNDRNTYETNQKSENLMKPKIKPNPNKESLKNFQNRKIKGNNNTRKNIKRDRISQCQQQYQTQGQGLRRIIETAAYGQQRYTNQGQKEHRKSNFGKSKMRTSEIKSRDKIDAGQSSKFRLGTEIPQRRSQDSRLDLFLSELREQSQSKMIKTSSTTFQFPKNKSQKYFKLPDLQLFGGSANGFCCSVSSQNHTRKPSFLTGTLPLSSKLSILTQSQLQFLQHLLTHIYCLRKFKMQLFESVLSFLIDPYGTVTKGEIILESYAEVIEMSEENMKGQLRNRLMDVMVYHGRVCKNGNSNGVGLWCGHLRTFYDRLGMPTSEVDDIYKG